LLCLLICHMAGSAVARPRPPGPPYPEIGVLTSFRFDSTNLLADSKSDLLLQHVALVESWSGYALSMEGKEPKLFAIPAVDGNGTTNLWTTAGTIRFWFKPSWSSISLGGNGPGVQARLFEAGAWSQTQSVGWWSLQLSQGGDDLSFVAGSQGECLDILKTAIHWKEGDWHQVAFSYSPEGSWLFLDGELAAQGRPVALAPLEKFNGVFGLCLGSDAQGLNVAQGQFEEVTTFKTVQDAGHLAWNYSCLAGFAVLGPITPEEDAARLARMQAARAERAMVAASSTLMPASSLPGDGEPDYMQLGDTNLWFLPPIIHVTNTTNIVLTLCNADTNKSYDIYSTYQLQNSNTVFSSIAVTGRQGQVSFAIPVTNWVRFFQAKEGNDWDGDSIPNWMDANPYSTNAGALTITILSPTNRATLY